MNNAKIDSERRALGVKRVNLETVVEICGRDAQVPAFEAESVELSGRGMHVRTAFLPELNAPLVLRFEDRGREVVIEGEVAWRRELEDAGEFGIKFTALDPKGVEVLRELCGTQARPSEQNAADQKPAAGPGSAVKLHIEGLNSPMRARVRDANVRRMQVGSNLEFLKVGRSIEVEDVDQGVRKDAKIDSVTVAIDPQTQVPQLVVALRYGDVTPEPSVVDSEPGEIAAAPSRRDLGVGQRPAPEGPSQMASSDDGITIDDSEDEDEFGLGDDVDDDFGAELGKGELKQKLERGLVQAQELAKKSGDYMGAFGKRTAAGFGKLMSGAGEQLNALRARRDQGPKRRTAAPASSSTFSQEVKRLKLQPQHRNRSTAPGNRRADGTVVPSKLRSRAAIGGIAAIALTAGLIFAFTGSSAKETASTAGQPSVALNAAANPASTLPGTAPQAGTPATGVQPQTIVADVPLFGQTTLSTPEPAPLGAAPQGVEQGETEPGVGMVPPPVAPGTRTAAESEYDDRAVVEEGFGDSPSKSTSDDEAESKRTKAPASVQPWGKGRLHLPTVHRLHLDGVATGLKGYSKANGFSVVLPGRKVVDNAKLIAKRDDRLASVTADSSREGAVVRFKFRGQVPTYKVRVRGEYVEFFISAVEKH
jgi:hypothetical protein